MFAKDFNEDLGAAVRRRPRRPSPQANALTVAQELRRVHHYNVTVPQAVANLKRRSVIARDRDRPQVHG